VSDARHFNYFIMGLHVRECVAGGLDIVLAVLGTS
jgi:hypothetical protein